MKRVLFILSLLLLLSLVCSCSKDLAIDLSTPENTLKSYYEAFGKSGFGYQKKTLQSSIESAGKERFNIIRPILLSHQILKIRVVKEKEYSFYQEGDVNALVKEIYRDNKESINSFILRKFDKHWLIIDFVTENKAEVPEDIKHIEKKAKDMMKSKGK
jgi:hypothetical protein